MGTHKSSDSQARKAKYTRQFARTEANKARNKANMLKDNPQYPNKKGAN